MSEKNDLPNVFGEKLTKGLIAERRNNHFNQAGSKIDNLLKQDAPRSRNQMYKRAIDIVKSMAGDGLISVKETGRAKDRVTTIKFCLNYSAGHVDFLCIKVDARRLNKGFDHISTPATISAHALQRCVQFMKTTHLGTLGKYLLKHAMQSLQVDNKNKSDWISILDDSVAVWSWYDGDQDYYAGRPSGTRYIIMKTIIPVDALDGKLARAYSRYKEGLDYQI